MGSSNNIGRDISDEHFETPFCDWVLSKDVKNGLKLAIQSITLPLVKSGMDLLIESKSDRDKTLIFATAALEMYKESKESYALVVAPANEVALQIEGDFKSLDRFCHDFKARAFINDSKSAENCVQIQNSNIVIGTPGHLVHMINNKGLNPSKVKLIIIDEADKFCEQDLCRNLQTIIDSGPNQRQVIACIDNFSTSVKKQIIQKMHKPILVSSDDKVTTPNEIKQFIYEVDVGPNEMENKLVALNDILSQLQFHQCLIFAQSKSRADSYYNHLVKDDWSCELVCSDLTQKTSSKNSQELRNFEPRLLFCTDLIVRDLNFEHVNVVINLDSVMDTATYLDRICRASHFGLCGIAISILSTDTEKHAFSKILSTISEESKIFCFPKDGTKENKVDFWDFNGVYEDYGKDLTNQSSKHLPASKKIDDKIQNTQPNQNSLQSHSQVDVFEDYFKFLVDIGKETNARAGLVSNFPNRKTYVKRKGKKKRENRNIDVEKNAFKDYSNHASEKQSCDLLSNQKSILNPEHEVSSESSDELESNSMSTTTENLTSNFNSKNYLIALEKWMHQYAVQSKTIEQYMECFCNSRN